MRRILYILLILIVGLSTMSISAQNNRRNLTSLLNEVASKRKVTISFSPTLTNNIYPKKGITNGSMTEILKNLLEDIDLDFKLTKRGTFFIFKSKKPIIEKPKPEPPKKPIIKIDTIKPADIKVYAPIPLSVKPLSINYAKFKSISVEPYNTPVISKVRLPFIAVKSNLLYDATTTFNLGIEIALAKKWTLDVSANYNPWKFPKDVRLKHFLIQPEVRYWQCERFIGHFFGLHAHFATFNVGALPNVSFVSDNMKQHRYEGYLYGAGISYGYHWAMSNRWSLEGVIGIGYARIHYDKFPCVKCGAYIKTDNKNYFGPTKVALNLIYIIK